MRPLPRGKRFAPCASFWLKHVQCSHFVWVALCFVCLTMGDKGASLLPPRPLSSRAPAVACPAGSPLPSTLSTLPLARARACCFSVFGRALTLRWECVTSRIRPQGAAPHSFLHWTTGTCLGVPLLACGLFQHLISLAFEESTPVPQPSPNLF